MAYCCAGGTRCARRNFTSYSKISALRRVQAGPCVGALYALRSQRPKYPGFAERFRRALVGEWGLTIKCHTSTEVRLTARSGLAKKHGPHTTSNSGYDDDRST